MTDRPTTTITTPGGKTVVLNAYLTGREEDDVKGAILSSMRFVSSAEGTAPEITGKSLLEQQNRALKYLVVSVDGDTNNPIDILLDGPASEYRAVVDEVNKIANPTTSPKPSTLGDDTTTTAL